MGKYKFTLKQDLVLHCPELDGVEVFERRLIVRDCIVRIPKNYSWNGCTFAPDLEETLLASCVHDALYQYRVNRLQSDRAFLSLLSEFEFKLLYYAAIRLFGWIWHRKRP